MSPLQFAHDRGIVHRDIKPENLLLDKDGRIKIADFGIARMLRGNDDGRARHGHGDDALKNASKGNAEEVSLTQECVLGTPSYMAPEQRDRPSSLDHRADIFSLGVVLYEMLTGELPGPGLQPPSRRVEIDVRLDEIVLRALEYQPELRFQSARELCTLVTTYSSGDAASPVSPRPNVSGAPDAATDTQPGSRHSGILIFLIGVMFVPFFLFGGGVVTSSHARMSTLVFFAAYITGLFFPGVYVYRSVVASTSSISSAPPGPAKMTRRIQWVTTFLMFLCIPAWMAFFRSAAFATPIGQNAFLIFIAASLAQLITLGLAFLRRGRRQPDLSERPQDAAAPELSVPHAMGLVSGLFALAVLMELARWFADGAPVRSVAHVAGLGRAVCLLIVLVMGGVAASLRILQALRLRDTGPEIKREHKTPETPDR